MQLVKPAPRGKPKNLNAVGDLMVGPVRIHAASQSGTSMRRCWPGRNMRLACQQQSSLAAQVYWSASNNFFAITQNKRSDYYAMSVVKLG